MPTATKSKTKSKTSTDTAFTVEAKVLQDAIAQLKKLAPNRPSHPILACFMIEASLDELRITATDLSHWLQIQIKEGYQGYAENSFCINAAYFSNLLNSLSGELSVEMLEQQIQIKTRSGKHKVAIAPTTDYPEFGMMDSLAARRQEAEIPASWLAGLRRVRPYADDDESKQVLCGVKLSGDNSGLELAATNGHYLARYRVTDAPTGGDIAEFEANVPAKAIDALPRFEDSSGVNTAYMRVEPGMIEFSANRWVFRSRLSEGQYPNYPQLIPSRFDSTCVMPLEELRDRLEPVKICACMKNKVMAMTLRGDTAYLVSEAPEVGKVQEQLACVSNTAPDDFMIGFNSEYVAIALKSFSGDEVRFNMNTPTSPVVVCSADKGDTLEVLIMPIKLKEGITSYMPTLDIVDIEADPE